MDQKTRNYYLSHGIVLLNGLLDKSEAAETLAGIEFISQKKSCKNIKLLINSPGGVAKYFLFIHKEIQKKNLPLATACVGIAEGCAALLLASGHKGLRSALSHSVINATDIWSAEKVLPTPEKLDVIKNLRAELNELWVQCTGKNQEIIKSWIASEKRFTANEALKAGIIDFIIPQQDIDGGQNGSILGLFRL